MLTGKLASLSPETGIPPLKLLLDAIAKHFPVELFIYFCLQIPTL